VAPTRKRRWWGTADKGAAFKDGHGGRVLARSSSMGGRGFIAKTAETKGRRQEGEEESGRGRLGV